MLIKSVFHRLFKPLNVQNVQLIRITFDENFELYNLIMLFIGFFYSFTDIKKGINTILNWLTIFDIQLDTYEISPPH